MGIQQRLKVSAKLLDEIEQHRARIQDPGRGSAMEHRIIERELRELERDILADPGALESQLVRVRGRRSDR